MTEERSSTGIPLATWLRAVQDAVGGEAGADLTAEEQTALLDLARIAAHRSERIAAPLSTFLAGAAYGSLPADARIAALQSLVTHVQD
jgi:hypothetical protein